MHNGFLFLLRRKYIIMVRSSKFQIFKPNTVCCIAYRLVSVKNSTHLAFIKPIDKSIKFEEFTQCLKNVLLVHCPFLKQLIVNQIRFFNHKLLSLPLIEDVSLMTKLIAKQLRSFIPFPALLPLKAEILHLWVDCYGEQL